MVKVTIEMDGKVERISEGDMAVCQTITNEDDGMKIQTAVVGNGNLDMTSNALARCVESAAKAAAENPLETIAAMVDVEERLKKGIEEYFTKNRDAIAEIIKDAESEMKGGMTVWMQ